MCLVVLLTDLRIWIKNKTHTWHCFLSVTLAAPAEQRARYRNFFEDFFADAELRNEEQEEVNEILEAVMIAGDVNEIQQAPNNRKFEIDVEEGWKSDSDALS